MDLLVAIRDTDWTQRGQVETTLQLLRSVQEEEDQHTFLLLHKSILPDRQMIPWILVMSRILDRIDRDQVVPLMQKFIQTFSFETAVPIVAADLGLLLHKFCDILETLVLETSEDQGTATAPGSAPGSEPVSKSKAIPVIELLYAFSLKLVPPKDDVDSSAGHVKNLTVAYLTPVHVLLLKLCWKAEFLVYAKRVLARSISWWPYEWATMSDDERVDLHIYSSLILGMQGNYRDASLHFTVVLSRLMLPDRKYLMTGVGSGYEGESCNDSDNKDHDHNNDNNNDDNGSIQSSSSSSSSSNGVHPLLSRYLLYLPRLLITVLLADLTASSLETLPAELRQELQRLPFYSKYVKIAGFCKSLDVKGLSQLVAQGKSAFDQVDGVLDLLEALLDKLNYALVEDSGLVYKSRKTSELFENSDVRFGTLCLFENVKISDKNKVLRYSQDLDYFKVNELLQKHAVDAANMIQVLKDAGKLVGGEDTETYRRLLPAAGASALSINDFKNSINAVNKRPRSSKSQKRLARIVPSFKAAKMKANILQDQDPEEAWSSDSHIGDYDHDHDVTPMEDDYDVDDSIDTEMTERRSSNDQ